MGLTPIRVLYGIDCNLRTVSYTVTFSFLLTLTGFYRVLISVLNRHLSRRYAFLLHTTI